MATNDAPVAPAKVDPTAAMVLAHRTAAQAKGKKAGRVLCVLTDDKDHVSITFAKKDFVKAIGPSSSGTTEGCTLVVGDKFTVKAPTGDKGEMETTFYGIEMQSWAKSGVVFE